MSSEAGLGLAGAAALRSAAVTWLSTAALNMFFADRGEETQVCISRSSANAHQLRCIPENCLGMTLAGAAGSGRGVSKPHQSPSKVWLMLPALCLEGKQQRCCSESLAGTRGASFSRDLLKLEFLS